MRAALVPDALDVYPPDLIEPLREEAARALGFLAGPPALMRGCLQIKAALTRLNTNLVSQRGALAALRDGAYRDGAQAAIRANLAHLEQTLAGVEGLALAVTPRRGLACAVELADEGPTAQELMVALFARRVAVYPGDGLGEERAATTVRLNLSAPTSAMDHLRGALGAALDEAASGRWRAPVAALLDGKGTARAARLADRVRRGR
jgi:aspartate/methionine/tyrosine aminotransferase